jgi:hypothetical protein
MVVAVAAAWWCSYCRVMMMPASAQPLALTAALKNRGIIQGECTAEAAENGACVDDLPMSSSSRNCTQLIEAFGCDGVRPEETGGGTYGIRNKCQLSCGVCRVFAIAGQELQDCVAAAPGQKFLRSGQLSYVIIRNKLTGFVPNLIWSGLSSLNDVDLADNRLTGMFLCFLLNKHLMMQRMCYRFPSNARTLMLCSQFPFLKKS